jgi:hypothetical protein
MLNKKKTSLKQGAQIINSLKEKIATDRWIRYGPDKWALKHFGFKKSDRIPTKQFALKSKYITIYYLRIEKI